MTTERVLPAIARPIPARPRPAVPRTAVPLAKADAPARAVARRSEALLTMPARAGMLLGVSAAIYAVSLAGVSGLQAQGDAELIARRQPYLDTIARIRAANDDLEAGVMRAGAQAEALGRSYTATADTMSAQQARLEALAALVAEVKGSAAALPARISLPSVSVHGTVRSAPRTVASTGASGKP